MTSFTLPREPSVRGGAIDDDLEECVPEQRVCFVGGFRALCQESDISRSTGATCGGVIRQPATALSPWQTRDEREQRVVKMRQRYPAWGVCKLQVLLAQAGVDLPASTIHRILLRRGLVRSWDRHEAALQRF